MLTVGIVSGAVWANEAWGSYWSWDPKETCLDLLAGMPLICTPASVAVGRADAQLLLLWLVLW